MINGLTIVANPRYARFSGAAALFGGVPTYILIQCQARDSAGNVLSQSGVESLATYLTGRGWNVYNVWGSTNGVVYSGQLNMSIIGNSSDNLRTVESTMNTTLQSMGMEISALNAQWNGTAVATGGATTPPPPIVRNPSGTSNPNPPATGKGLDDYLKELGAQIGFSPTSALIGGAAVIGVGLIILLKKN